MYYLNKSNANNGGYMKKDKSAFTLIELLVVIAIIALLLAIIIPSLKRAKEKAEFLFCEFNLKAYGLSMKLYLDEWDDKYPYCFDSMWNADFTGLGFTVPLDCQWHDERMSPNNHPQLAGPLWEYMDTDAAHMCPTFKRFAKIYGEDHPNHVNTIPITPQYAYSQNAFLGEWPGGTIYGVQKESQVVTPAETLVWVEETIWLIPGWAGWTLNDTCFFSRHYKDSTQWGDFIATYHNTPIDKRNDGVGNAVFVDGHVQLNDPYRVVQLPGGGEARQGFILSWPRLGKLSSEMYY
jgi:prepilin-type N-terminal cleavage/methylation domain-containing protein/prepilin-type processing-associated H-X9-DG protein